MLFVSLCREDTLEFFNIARLCRCMVHDWFGIANNVTNIVNKIVSH